MGKKIIRVGKSTRGTVIHIIVEKGNKALCEKKQVGLIVDKALTIEDVTCKRCMATPVFKKELENVKLKKIIVEADQKAKEERLTKEEARPESKPEVDKEAKPIEDSSFYKKKLRNGNFKLIHQATEKTFFSNIEEKVASIALKFLNEIETKWESKHDNIPKEYIPKCRAAVALAYKQSNIALPNAFEKTFKDDEKPKIRSIKRRGKKNKKDRKITRKKKKERSKSNSQKLLDFVIEEMHNGISLADLIEGVTEQFDLTSKKGASKVKKTIRRLRKKDIIMAIETRPSKNDDIYTIEHV